MLCNALYPRFKFELRSPRPSRLSEVKFSSPGPPVIPMKESLGPIHVIVVTNFPKAECTESWDGAACSCYLVFLAWTLGYFRPRAGYEHWHNWPVRPSRRPAGRVQALSPASRVGLRKPAVSLRLDSWGRVKEAGVGLVHGGHVALWPRGPRVGTRLII